MHQVPIFDTLTVWLPAFATFLTVRRMLKVITKTYNYDKHIQKTPPKEARIQPSPPTCPPVLPPYHFFLVTLHFDNSDDPVHSPTNFLHKNLLSRIAEDKCALWMEFPWYMLTNFEMYFICFAFILCAATEKIYFQNQLVFLEASRNETPIYNSAPMGSKKWHDSSLCDQHLVTNYITGRGVTCILIKTNN